MCVSPFVVYKNSICPVVTSVISFGHRALLVLSTRSGRKLPGYLRRFCFGSHTQFLLSLRVRCFSRHRAERGGHFTHDLLCVGYAVSPRDPTRLVIGKPCCASCIFPDECLQWQIDSDRLRRLHQRCAAAG